MQIPHRALIVSLFSALMFVACPSLHAQAPLTPSGHWEGTIAIPDHELKVTVDLAKNAAGAWIGSLSIPGSTTIDVPMSTVAFADDAVRFSANLPEKTTFEGRLSADAKHMAGSVANAEGAVPFDLARTGEAAVKVAPPSTALPKAFAGNWEGALVTGATTVRIGLKMSASADGTASATLQTLDQPKVEEIPATTVAIKDAEITIEVRSLTGTYHGVLGANGEIAGQWTQGPATVPLTFRRSASN